YVTATKTTVADLVSGQPVLWSARVNTKPLLYGESVQGSGYVTPVDGVHVPYPPPFNNEQFGNDFNGATIAPDGSPWASFDQDCGPDPDSGDCPAQHQQTRGFAGRLYWP